MPSIYPGYAKVRLSFFWLANGQSAQIDINVSAFNESFDVDWSGQDYLAALTFNGQVQRAKAMVSSAAQFRGMKLYWKPVAKPPVIDRSTTAAGYCTGGNNLLPTQLAGLISWSSSVGGARGRGRSYIPFAWPEASNESGLPTPEYLNLLADFGNMMLLPLIIPNVGAGEGDVRVGPCTIYTTGVTPIAKPMTGFYAAGGFATQRRRGYFGQLNKPPL